MNPFKISCERGYYKGSIAYLLLRKESDSNYSLYYRLRDDRNVSKSSVFCKGQDQGVTCFANEGNIFRIDYAFEVNGEAQGAKRFFEKVKFGNKDDYRCALGRAWTNSGIQEEEL